MPATRDPAQFFHSFLIPGPSSPSAPKLLRTSRVIFRGTSSPSGDRLDTSLAENRVRTWNCAKTQTKRARRSRKRHTILENRQWKEMVVAAEGRVGVNSAIQNSRPALARSREKLYFARHSGLSRAPKNSAPDTQLSIFICASVQAEQTTTRPAASCRIPSTDTSHTPASLRIW